MVMKSPASGITRPIFSIVAIVDGTSAIQFRETVSQRIPGRYRPARPHSIMRYAVRYEFRRLIRDSHPVMIAHKVKPMMYPNVGESTYAGPPPEVNTGNPASPAKV